MQLFPCIVAHPALPSAVVVINPPSGMGMPRLNAVPRFEYVVGARFEVTTCDN